MASEVDDDAEKREDVQIYTMGDFQSSILAARGSTFDALGRFDVLYMQTVLSHDGRLMDNETE
ncbi:hypothetical protein N7489_004181 [Penicillium chrysogenum]|uniref:uncharacterized protein n=1 Tax=Penicillium chrysogenum TaxID=5076 RepID=UPI0024DF0752|nr:uncharacterized protein N7489_004181 [Penicillium chrysogenum]KAJ5244085.1 hypothetical protein N7489_004181 [Penicillium chrysogenum]